MQNRHLVGFSAHVAKILNTPGPDGWVRVRPFALWMRLMRTLAHGRDGEHRRRILGAHLMGLDSEGEDAEQAAETWMREVLQRPLRIRAGRQAQQAHLLLEALIRRAPGMEDARLMRGGEPPDGEPPALLADLAVRLGRLAAAREVKGAPLRLEVEGAALPVPPELSVWEALEHAPPLMRVLATPAEQDPFFHLMIRAMETANVLWGRSVALGLSPKDHDLSVNQIKSLQAFVAAAGGRRTRPERAALEAAWAKSPVTNFRSLDAFLADPVGRELFAGFSQPSLTPFDEARDAEIPAEESRLTLDDETLRRNLKILRARAVIDDLDLQIYDALLKERALKDIHGLPWARKAFPTFDSLIDHTDMLVKKIDREIAAFDEEGPEDR